jgi:uncharacterized protein (TIGR02466 family)
MDSIYLFPTQVFHLDLPDPTDLNTNLLRSVDLLKLTDPGVVKSNVKGWHSDDKILLHHPDFAELLAIVNGAVIEACSDLKWNINLRVSNCWITVSPPGASNTAHTHPGSILSGVYYIQAPTGSSPLVLHDPRSAKVHCIPQGQPATPSTADKISLEVKTGRLFLFPGWLTHSVAGNTTEKDRVVFSFNMIVAG